MSGSIYLDTNILISLFEGDGPAHNALWDFIRLAIDLDGVSFHTSALSFAELLVKPYASRDDVLARHYLTLAKSEGWLTVHQVGPAIIDTAAVIRARRRLRLPDAIHLATAAIHSCRHFLTFDAGIVSMPTLDHPISGKPVGISVDVIRPDQYSLSELAKALIT